ncbi:MAG: hypothetical protein LBU77_01575 [Clostridiales bacterium]|nr:hypothetical protein [Clostridiales bacterium]
MRSSKKSIAALTVMALALTAMPFTAFAGHHGRGHRAHTLNDGHDYHQVCAIEDCTVAGVHVHDGVSYFAHENNDGHSYHANGHAGAGCHR